MADESYQMLNHTAKLLRLKQRDTEAWTVRQPNRIKYTQLHIKIFYMIKGEIFF